MFSPAVLLFRKYVATISPDCGAQLHADGGTAKIGSARSVSRPAAQGCSEVRAGGTQLSAICELFTLRLFIIFGVSRGFSILLTSPDPDAHESHSSFAQAWWHLPGRSRSASPNSIPDIDAIPDAAGPRARRFPPLVGGDVRGVAEKGSPGRRFQGPSDGAQKLLPGIGEGGVDGNSLFAPGSEIIRRC